MESLIDSLRIAYTYQMLRRNYAFDILRLSAALVVFLGHLLFWEGHLVSLNSFSFVTSIFHTGAFSVHLFFMLSGVALRIQTAKYGVNLMWLKARLVRLLPMYWFAYLIPLLGLFAIDEKMDISPLQLLITLVSLNALVPMWSVPQHNPALWSLSIEVILSASLLIFGKFKNTYFHLTILSCLMLINCFLGDIKINAFIFFYF